MTDHPFTYLDIAKMIDHALLSPQLTVAELESGIELARRYEVASVCIQPYYLARCTERLIGSSVLPSTTIGFPHGGHTTTVKQAEAIRAIADGCQELDMVVNIGWVRSGRWEAVRADIQAVIEVAHAAQRKVKVIFENCYLSDDQKIRLCEVCGELRADWVKTSTGFGTGGAMAEDLILMRKHSPPGVQVKASGGIRSLDQLLAFRALQVSRVGASGTAAILEECRRRLGLSAIGNGSCRTP